jgi:hypothetical protein
MSVYYAYIYFAASLAIPEYVHKTCQFPMWRTVCHVNYHIINISFMLDISDRGQTRGHHTEQIASGNQRRNDKYEI